MKNRKFFSIIVILIILVAAFVFQGFAGNNSDIPEGFKKNAKNPLEGKNLTTENLSDREVRDDYKDPNHPMYLIYNGFINFEYKGEYYYIYSIRSVYKTDNGSIDVHNLKDDLLIGEFYQYDYQRLITGGIPYSIDNVNVSNNNRNIYLNENFLYYYLSKYISTMEGGGCFGADGRDVIYKKYQAYRFDLETGTKEEITDEEFFEAIK